MKAKTNELTGAALDWVVANCEGTAWLFEVLDGTSPPGASYCTDWAQGGPIIEREKIDLSQFTDGCDELTWVASAFSVKRWGYGPTPLIASMRCYVASKLGDEVDVPKDMQGEHGDQ